MTGTEYLRQVYLLHHPGLRPGTVEQYAIAARKFDEFCGVPIEQWTATLIASWVATYAKSPSTANSKRRAICTLWLDCDQAAPVKAVPKYRELKRAPQAWTLAEVTAIVEECRKQQGTNDGILWSDWWESLVLACYDTGTRISSLLSLQTGDLNMTDGWILLQAESDKTGADRVCQLAPDTLDVLSRHYDQRRENVWPWPYHHHTIWPMFRRIVVAAGVRYPKGGRNLFHRFRRTSGSLIEQAGGSGCKHLGNSPRVFEQSYRDRTMSGSQVHLLPRPTAKPALRVVG